MRKAGLYNRVMDIWTIVLTVIVIIAILMVVKIQQRTREQLLVQQRARDHAQLAHQQEWKEQQEKRLTQLEERLMAQMHTLLEEMHTKEVQDSRRIDDLKCQYKTALSQAHTEYALAQLPRIEDTPLPGSVDALPEGAEKKNQSLSLPGVDLSDRDLSHRYLSHANLQNASLARANLFMADLSSANLAGADLSYTNLSAANLAHADLRDANLEGANLLVADLNDANLSGANLHNTRSFTTEQLQTAIIDKNVPFNSNDGSEPLHISTISDRDNHR